VLETIELKEHEDETVELSDSDADFILHELAGRITIHREVHGQGYVLNPNQFVGVISLPSGRHLESHPKIPVRNLFYMLAVAFQLRSPLRPETVELDRIDEIIEFVASVFASAVEEKIGNGLYRWYVEKEDNVPAIRGRIDFAEDVRRNYVLRQRTYCRFDEFAWDIPENQVVRQVIHFLSGWGFRPKLRWRLGQIDAELNEVSRSQFLASDLDRIHYHRLNEDYHRLHQFCRLFLEGASLFEDLGTFEFRAFLLDMNKLFEEFVCQILRDKVSGTLRIDSQEWIHLDRDERIIMKPDILIRRGGAVALAADCKYKRLESDEFKNHDVYQLLAYCIATNSRKGLLIYPLNLEKPCEEVWIQNSATCIRQISIDLRKEPGEFIRTCNSFTDEVFAYAQA
jgi:5-methylcytosine-specific restriction enzyme subunit McrC